MVRLDIATHSKTSASAAAAAVSSLALLTATNGRPA